MKFTMTMTADEIVAIVDIYNQIVPDTVDMESVIPAPGMHKVTTVKNQKVVMETSENSEDVAVSMYIEPEYMIAIYDMLGGFTSNIAGACKALSKHGKLLMQIAGAEEIIKTINGLIVGKECNEKGEPLNIDTEDETEVEEEEEDKVEEKEEESDIPTPIADIAKHFNV